MNPQINKLLSSAKTVAIIGHINPDGDCFGSISAINDYISTKHDCVIHCFAQCETIAEEFKPFAKDINFNPQPLDNYDLCICVDAADVTRLGNYIDVFYNSKATICIDHHSTNKGYADINIINTISSNCENIYNLLREDNFEISKCTAGKLFAGIVTDTNNLSTNMVTANTYKVAMDLINKGINYYKIIKFFMGGNSMPQYRLLSMAMNGAQFYNKNTIMVMRITTDQLTAAGGTQEDLNPIINQAFCMKHAKAALLITPRNGQSHVSFRSRGDIDVSTLAQHFGGGGHKPAAAFTKPELTNEDLQFIINSLSQQINALPEEKEDLF